MIFLATCTSVKGPEQMPLLKVSENKRFLSTEKGDPFFWLGDTGWLLFTKLNREEAERYLEDRYQKGFNVIQVMVIHNIMKGVNTYGDSALINHNLGQPFTTPGDSPGDSLQYDFWDHVDYIVNTAAKKGIYMALVPVWGSNVKSGKVTSEQARKYAEWLSERYSDKPNVIWVNGGDLKGSDSTAVWQTIGKTLRKNTRQLITYHPFGRTQSSTWFHNEGWLDFNMFQSGHRRYDQDTDGLMYGEDNWRYVIDDYNKTPVKPTLDGEPSYDGIPQGLHDPAQPYWNDSDVRRYAYWSVFAGGCGFTYGNNAVMQFHRQEETNGSYGVKDTWESAINAPGASQLRYLKELILSKPYFERISAPELIADPQKEKYDYLAATKGKNYAFIYTFNGSTFNIDLSKIDGKEFKATWFSPRNGGSVLIGDFQYQKIKTFDPPGEKENGNDWVLEIEWK
jgi:hypothetical protein